MRRFFEIAAQLAHDTDFVNFQNGVVRAAYDALSQAYASAENEVSIITRLVTAINEKSYGRLIHIAANKIHGPRSYVEFNFRDKPTTRELGDMVAISIVTAGKRRLVERVCIIQNKKAKNQNWGIDAEQLFLLKNFPPFTGNRGIFRGMDDVVFRNSTGCLGAFGLLSEPGEMIFASAPLLAEFLAQSSTLEPADVSFPSVLQQGGLQSSFASGPVPFPGLDPDEYYFILRDVMRRIGPVPWPGVGLGIPFLGNLHFARDLYDFIRGWTQINIGEFTCWRGATANPEVDSFATRLIRTANLGRAIDFPVDERSVEMSFEGDIAVLLLHMDIGSED